jgi:cytochrome c-type biogenesis protein CcmH
MRLVSSWCSLMVFCLWFVVNHPTEAKVVNHHFTFQSAAQEARYRMLIDEFRCPKCQNVNLAGSDAPIAQDLKYKTYTLLIQGQSDEQIRQYMISRYGEFISYKPPMSGSTSILWFVPPLLLVLGAIYWLLRARARQHINIVPLSAEESWRLSQLLNNKQIGAEKRNTNRAVDDDTNHER